MATAWGLSGLSGGRLGLLLLLTTVSAACGPSKPAENVDSGGGGSSAKSSTPSNTKVTAFGISNTENLRVDKVGMRDGALSPDGSMDLVFTATINGPFDAVFIYSTNDKGEPA